MIDLEMNIFFGRERGLWSERFLAGERSLEGQRGVCTCMSVAHA